MKRLAFSDPMYLAFLEGRKTQTRRIIHPQPGYHDSHSHDLDWKKFYFTSPDGLDHLTVKPAYLPGETVAIAAALARDPINNVIRFRANNELTCWTAWSWKNNVLPARFCPLWCCKHTAKIVKVRVEQVRYISHADCVREGLAPTMRNDPDQDIRYRYSRLWDSLHPQPGENWEKNPWVFAYEFIKVS